MYEFRCFVVHPIFTFFPAPAFSAGFAFEQRFCFLAGMAEFHVFDPTFRNNGINKSSTHRFCELVHLFE